MQPSPRKSESGGTWRPELNPAGQISQNILALIPMEIQGSHDLREFLSLPICRAMKQLFFGGLQTISFSFQKETTTPAFQHPSLPSSLLCYRNHSSQELPSPASPHSCKKTPGLNKILAVTLPRPRCGHNQGFSSRSRFFVFMQQSSLFPSALSLSVNQAPDLDSHSRENSQDDSTQIRHRRVGMSETTRPCGLTLGECSVPNTN